MARKYEYSAKDRKTGMTLDELQDAVREVSGFTDQECRYRLEARVTIGGKLLSVAFVEVN